MNDILQNGPKYNSWFIDCDATGEIYDDYSAKHITTQEQDLKSTFKTNGLHCARKGYGRWF